MWQAIITWLNTYEAIAIWLEGIALLAIFIWDRFDAGDAHDQSTKQLSVFRDQVEATHRPFVSYSSVPRDAEDVVLGVGGSNAATEIWCPDAQAQIKNYGSGPAINLHYALTPTNPESTVARPEGYLVALRQGARFKTPIARGILQGNEWETVITYESLSGRKYRTKITSDNLVMTKINVTQLS
jgi:hypothetical protein